jgi:hypothetical protein
MSAISDILGVKPKQEEQPVTPQANPQYPVDWQNGQTSSGGQAPSAIQGNTNPNYGQNGEQTPPIPQGNTNPNYGQNGGQATQQQATATPPTSVIETPEQAYNRVLNEKGEAPSEAYKAQVNSLTELNNYLNETLARTKRTKEQEERENKRAKQRALYSAISDGLQALSNLYFTTNGAPNAYNPNASMSKANLARWDKMVAQREKDDAKYMAALKYKYDLDSQAVQQELAAKKAREKLAQDAFNRVIAQSGLDIKVRDSETRKKAAEAKAEYDRQRAEDQRRHNEGMLNVAQQRAATSAAVGASTIARNQAAADKYRSETSAGGTGKPDKQGRMNRYIYVPRGTGNAERAKEFTVHVVYATEAEANAAAKKYKGAYVNSISEREGPMFGAGKTTQKGGYRYIPSAKQNGSAVYYDDKGKRIKFDRSKGKWVSYGEQIEQKPSQWKNNRKKPS